MDNTHKIPVEFARSIKRKIDVQVDKLIDYEYTTINMAHYRPSGGSAKAETIIAVTITGLILLIVSLAVMLSLNG